MINEYRHSIYFLIISNDLIAKKTPSFLKFINVINLSFFFIFKKVVQLLQMFTKWSTCRLFWHNQGSNIMLYVCYEVLQKWKFVDETMGILCWRDIVDMLWSVSTGLNVIHEHDLVHGHLHGGNILIESEIAKIADTGLHGPVDKQTSQPTNLWCSTFYCSRNL
jgi:hypothetical protein